MIPTQICSKCHEDFMNCKCEQFHPNIIDPESYEISKARIEYGDSSWSGFKKEFLFTIEELKALYKLLEHQFIPYENQEAHDVVNKIVKILRENENVSRSKSI